LSSLRYDSLRKRLVLPFGLLGLFVSALLSGITFWLVADIEEYATERVLQLEMESFRHRIARDPAATPPSASLIHGDFLPSPDLPSIVPPASEAQRFRRQRIDGREYTVLVEDVAGRPYALLHDRTVINAGLTDLAWVLAIGSILMGVLSALVGHVLAGQVVRPIRRLLTEISEKSSAIDIRADAPPSFSAANYPGNEIGQLVRALDEFALRLHGFVQRESDFAADVSHELRTPIAVIRGAAEVLAEYPEFPEPARERLLTIHRQSVRMGEIVDAMLLLARENSLSGDPACAMAEVVEEAMADCRPWLQGRPIQVIFDIRDRPIVAVERSLAYVVISNLLRNACVHTREGSITIRLLSDRLEIIDTGIGIPEHRFPEIFSRHVKGEESAGSGLGLSIVARITEMIRWQIGIESRAGAGTFVAVRFADPDAAGVG
jgi:signal transduction histidine kinase